MEWIYLLTASLFEIGWPFGLKIATISSHKILWITFAVISMILSGIFLYFAQKNIPIGTAYAIWTGIGAVGTFLLGIYIFHDTSNLLRFIGVLFIITGIACLKIG